MKVVTYYNSRFLIRNLYFKPMPIVESRIVIIARDRANIICSIKLAQLNNKMAIFRNCLFFGKLKNKLKKIITYVSPVIGWSRVWQNWISYETRYIGDFVCFFLSVSFVGRSNQHFNIPIVLQLQKLTSS